MCLQPSQVKVFLGFGFARSSSSDGAKTYSIFLTLYKRFCADKTMNFQHDFSLLCYKRRWSLVGFEFHSLEFEISWLIVWTEYWWLDEKFHRRENLEREIEPWRSLECSRNLWHWRQQVQFISVVYGWLKFHEIVRNGFSLLASRTKSFPPTYVSNKPLRATFAGDIRDFSFCSLGVDLLLNSCAKNSIPFGWGSLSFRVMFWGWN